MITSGNKATEEIKNSGLLQERMVEGETSVVGKVVLLKVLCSICGVEIDNENQYPSDRKRNGHYCKKCHNEINTRNYKKWLKNPGVRERNRLHQMEWLKTHPDYMEKWEEAHGDIRYMQHMKKHLEKRYGVTLESIIELADKQNWKCAICETDLKLARYNHSTRKRELHHYFMVDHDHKTGQLRGVLCFNCNNLLGQAKDDPIILMRAVDYLKVGNTL